MTLGIFKQPTPCLILEHFHYPKEKPYNFPFGMIVWGALWTYSPERLVEVSGNGFKDTEQIKFNQENQLKLVRKGTICGI